jgi:nucleoside-diphosphate-sugar epimerase
MHVLVIGGTGFNGRRIVDRLLGVDHRVTVVSRGDLPAAWHGRVNHLRVDRREPGTLTTSLDGQSFDAVIDNIAYQPADAELTLRALGTRIGQYLFTSTMAVYHDLLSRTSPVVEDEADLSYRPGPEEGLETALHPTRGHAYAIDKRQVEQVLAAQPAVPWTALRAATVVGPDDWVGGIWWWMQRLQDGGPILIPETGPGHAFQITYVEDLADAFLAALGNPLAYGRAYNIAGPHLLTPETWAQALAAPLGRQVDCVRVPPEVIHRSGLAQYRLPIAGLPFGHALLDTCRARHDLHFQGTALDTWARDTALGRIARPPTDDSRHYAARQSEIGLALAYREARHQSDTSFGVND